MNPCQQIMIRLRQEFQMKHTNELKKVSWKSTVRNVFVKESLKKDVFEPNGNLPYEKRDRVGAVQR